MRKTLWSPLIIGILILAPDLICYANGPGTTTANFLKIGLGARAVAMGEAFTALASDGTSLYWNPAGLTQLKTKEFSAAYNSWFEEIKQGYLSLIFPTLRGTMGLGTNYVDMGKLEGRDVEGNPTGDFTASDTHIFFGYARKFKKSSWGLTVGWLQDTIKDDKKNTFLANIGFLYPLSERFILGGVAQNIGGKLGSDPLPLNFKVGAAFKFKALTLAVDVVKPQDNEIYYCLGAEWWLRNALALRVGYKTNQDIGKGITAGIGLKMGKTSIDYGYVPYGDLGNTHRISLGMKF
ncbi:PorV/PorQ family protein [Candidatus Aerophobetes bacterium]|uniref:PorV/PorQ family protein n=1 Tax=Aerophobetes bacterium TaxID=2030807 RepID=A0A523RZA9_UNCAE|nr:MAG: PorV/PorQ family protein [Candidatus Aerophobetes bacterium]